MCIYSVRVFLQPKVPKRGAESAGRGKRGKRRAVDQRNSNSSEKAGNSKKRRRKEDEMAANSESGEEEEAEGKGRGKVKEFRISDTAVSKWKPISTPARRHLSEAMVAALG